MRDKTKKVLGSLYLAHSECFLNESCCCFLPLARLSRLVPGCFSGLREHFPEHPPSAWAPWASPTAVCACGETSRFRPSAPQLFLGVVSFPGLTLSFLRRGSRSERQWQSFSTPVPFPSPLSSVLVCAEYFSSLLPFCGLWSLPRQGLPCPCALGTQQALRKRWLK